MVCQSCHRQGPTRNTWFIQNIGVIVAWFHKTVRGEMCRTCIDKYFWEYTLITFFFGWWGIISFFVTCVTLPVNIFNYLSSLSLPAIPPGAGAAAVGPAVAAAAVAPGAWPQSTPAPAGAGWPASPSAGVVAASPYPPPPGSYGHGHVPPPASSSWSPPPAFVMPITRGNSTLLFVLGIIGFLWTGMWLVLGVVMLAMPSTPSADPKAMDDVTAGITVLIFSLVVFGGPSALFFFLGLRGRNRATAIEKIASLAATHSPLPLSQIAQELRITPEKARDLVLFGVGKSWLAGRLDAAEGVFLSSTAAPGAQQVAQKCPSCGGESTVMRAPGLPAQCRYCGMALP